MLKYDKITNYQNNDLSSPLLIEGENLIWSAKPKKSAFIVNKVLAMMPFALVWLLFDLAFLIPMISSGQINEMLFIIIPFFVIHLLPVWIWLGNVVTANKRWKNTKYYVTDKRIMIQTGFIGTDYQTIYYKDIKNVNLRIGIIDKLLGVGDVYFELGNFLNYNTKVSAMKVAFLDVENPYEIYPKLQKIVLDIQTDIEYPNALRTDENYGYNTKYKGE